MLTGQAVGTLPLLQCPPCTAGGSRPAGCGDSAFRPPVTGCSAPGVGGRGGGPTSERGCSPSDTAASGSIITRELRDTLFRHSGIAPGTEAMPTTRTILTMLLNRYSEPPGSPEHAGTIVEAVVVLRNRSPPAARRAQVYVLVPCWKDTMNLQEMSEGFGAQVRSQVELPDQEERGTVE